MFLFVSHFFFFFFEGGWLEVRLQNAALNWRPSLSSITFVWMAERDWTWYDFLGRVPATRELAFTRSLLSNETRFFTFSTCPIFYSGLVDGGGFWFCWLLSPVAIVANIGLGAWKSSRRVVEHH